MSHAELLAKVDDEGEFLVQHFDSKPKVHSALRAVVELHKPFNYSHHFTDKVFIYCSTCKNHEYPCPTIQAIEKELT
jgi:hypothetical protein